MNRFARLGVALVLVVSVTSFAPRSVGPAVAAGGIDAVFGPLFGSWRGRGAFRQALDKPRESVVCKVKYNKSSATRVRLNVRCSGADFAIKASGTVIYNPNSKRFRGTLRDPGMGWTMRLSGGLRSRGRLRFALVIPEAKTRGWMSIRSNSRKRHSIIVMSVNESKGKLTESLKINFRR